MIDARTHLWSADVLPEFRLGLENLRAHKLRSLLTMLGMIFGVAAVVAMLSIGAGAQQEVMAFIEQLGVRNLIVEAREAPDNQTLQKVRKLSAGLSFQDLRIIQTNLDGIAALSARKRFTPSKLTPRPLGGDSPIVYGVSPSYQVIGNLQVATGRFFDDSETSAAAPVAVLGEAAAAALFGTEEPVGKYVKVNDQWFRVVGVAGPQLTVQADVGGVPAQDRNNVIYVPLYSSVFRLEDGQSSQKDEIDGIYVQMKPGSDVPAAAALIRGILDVAHRGAGDFTIISPAELLAEQRRTQRIFEMVMVAIASISLLVGGIGIMNIMLASVLERTREIGVRRAIGARQKDVVRQFLIETTIISLTGGVAGILLGVGLSQLIGILAGWSTIVTTGSIVLAFGVSVFIGIVFGLYPAVRASRLDPVTALHYE
ncbi:MAG TPA: ABC transporter permease [Vicinamibacterales bacterium]|jgi:putative ABC transport system permease protein|nr:ABC transporter permease [Vicinamibacterales bacterium]